MDGSQFKVPKNGTENTQIESKCTKNTENKKRKKNTHDEKQNKILHYFSAKKKEQ